MNELITTTTATIGTENVTAVNARELWKFLGSKQEFANWIKSRIHEYGFKENDDFLTNLSKSHGRPSKDYIITLDMAKELAMVENNDKGRQARRYFIEIEKQYRKQDAHSLNQDVLMATLYNEMERRIKAETERDEYKRNLRRMAVAANLNFGELSDVTGLPKDVVIAPYCKSNTRKHRPQTERYIQLILPLREIVEEYQRNYFPIEKE